ncbi:protein IMPAIRED IN BABA-INDUCED STERILITY 1-like isoform X3 [Carya illinoinensis]|uniref:protein IMPAIRED IN BABA-INDUCED STERILITY 1-like isoform X3 n=1 Tax=Carya illinoinensis TaxID=32201 RepID=UPI001C72621D|nr:protein IMPAIRED IN BABA-INDUCED STERILITY 1-like isoform X3 [Carya illinoinensis]
MGCVSSKQAVPVTPDLDHFGAFLDSGVGSDKSGHVGTGSGENGKGNGSNNKKKKSDKSLVVVGLSGVELGESGRPRSNVNYSSLSFRLGNLQEYVDGEHVAAGWPAWLSAVAGEAIQGWIPLRGEAFEKLEKIGQGTYSSVFRARNTETGRIVALKKVQFDNFEPESVRFMAREIMILRRLDHPNIIKLEGLITSRLSCSIYLVFDYMEHDITGLLSCPDIKFSESQVEQLHKIFKLCGSPADEYWKKTKLPHATLFKPQRPYNSCLQETFKNLPKTTISLLETLLSIEPYKRGTASSALASEYFTTKPHACDPSSLPVYPPYKEIDAKSREETKRKRIGGRVRGPEITRKPSRKLHEICKLAPAEEMAKAQDSHKINGSNGHILREVNSTKDRGPQKPSVESLGEGSDVKNASQVENPLPRPLQVSASSNFAWAKRRNNDASIRSHSRTISRGQTFSVVEPTTALHARSNVDYRRHKNGDVITGTRSNCRGYDSHEVLKLLMQNNWCKLEHPDSFDASDEYHSQELSMARYEREEIAAKRSNLGYQNEGDKVEFSGPLLSQSNKVDELLEKHERHIRRTVRNSWFQRGKKHGK